MPFRMWVPVLPVGFPGHLGRCAKPRRSQPEHVLRRSRRPTGSRPAASEAAGARGLPASAAPAVFRLAVWVWLREVGGYGQCSRQRLDGAGWCVSSEGAFDEYIEWFVPVCGRRMVTC